MPALASLEGKRATVVWNEFPVSRPVHLKLRLPEGIAPDFSADALDWDSEADEGQRPVLHGPLPAEAFTVKQLRLSGALCQTVSKRGQTEDTVREG